MLTTAIDSTFYRYAELNAPCMIQAELLPSEGSDHVSVLVTGEQDGNEVFRSTVLAPPTLDRRHPG